MERSLILKQFRRLLLVDDEPSVLFALRLLLNALGFEVKEFQSPSEALSYAQTNASEIDVVLSDLKMPKMDGIEFLQKLREQKKSEQINSIGCSTLPFVLMSAHATPDDVNRALTLGATGFLAKPFTPDDLFSLLSEYTASDNTEAAGENISAGSTLTLRPFSDESDLQK